MNIVFIICLCIGISDWLIYVRRRVSLTTDQGLVTLRVERGRPASPGSWSEVQVLRSRPDLLVGPALEQGPCTPHVHMQGERH